MIEESFWLLEYKEETGDIFHNWFKNGMIKHEPDTNGYKSVALTTGRRANAFSYLVEANNSRRKQNGQMPLKYETVVMRWKYFCFIYNLAVYNSIKSDVSLDHRLVEQHFDLNVWLKRIKHPAFEDDEDDEDEFEYDPKDLLSSNYI
ncbi:MAG: hypothetical protein MJZ30_09545 [Paludibacteraceae bacterium]|nr:hypothetical protein [Paludibacteraceae bacterium]